MNRALLVGINTYPDAPLSGCVNDVVDMANLVTKKCGFDPANVRILTDARATTQAIRERLRWLVSGLKAGDRVLFHYSGHGAQVPTRNPSGEVDGLDEVICPVDFDWDHNMVRDKEFDRIFQVIPKGVTAMWISDSCHSGDLSRDMPLGKRKARRMIAPPDIAWRFVGARHKGITRTAMTIPNIALLSGCRSDQTSADAVFKGRANGALTFYLLQTFQAGWLTKPLPEVLETVRLNLRKANFDQVPQLEGSRLLTERPFLYVGRA